MDKDMIAKRQKPAKTMFAPLQIGLLQRECACGRSLGVGGECAECRNQQLSLQRSATNTADATTAPPVVQDVLQSSGQPLDSAARASMEPHFGHNFSNVRVHTNAKAAESAHAVNALAYTVGRNIVFGEGQYAPQTSKGKSLLAHELTHVVQQGGFASGPINMNSPNDTGESEANHTASSILMEHKANVKPLTSTLFLQRKGEGTQESPGEEKSPKSEKSPVTRCPTSVRIGTVDHHNFSDLTDTEKEKTRTYLTARTRMDVGPGTDHTGHCMKETVTLVDNSCPSAMYDKSKLYTKDKEKVEPCTSNRCLDINRFGSGPTAFIDEHRTRAPISLLEDMPVKECSVTCEQTYACDRKYPATGTFLITRNFKADTYTRKDGKKIHVTTGTVTKTQKGV